MINEHPYSQAMCSIVQNYLSDYFIYEIWPSSHRECLWRGEKRQSKQERVLAKLRELAATDGVVANGLNLAWIWTSRPPPTPLERGQSLLWMKNKPAGKRTDRTASLSGPALSSPKFHPWSVGTEDSVIKCTRDDGVKDTIIHHQQQPIETVKTHPYPQLLTVYFNPQHCWKLHLLFVCLSKTGCGLILEGEARMTQTFLSSVSAWPWSNSLQSQSEGSVKLTFTQRKDSSLEFL